MKQCPVHRLVIALALLLAPLLADNGRAMAMADRSKAVNAGHCGDPPADHDGGRAKPSCCAPLCGAAAVLPALTSAVRRIAGGLERPGPDSSQYSFLAKLPTPPPRAA